MTTSNNIKWAVIASISDKGFSKKYISALKKAGFMPIGFGNDLFGNFYNSADVVSVDRIHGDLKKLNAKVASYKHKQAVLAFTITDKQFGLIGSKKVDWAKCKVPTKAGVVPVTYEQMFESGCIALPGSQARYNHPNKSFLI